MKVIASRRGYFGRLIEAGEAFDVPDGTRASWFKPMDKGVPVSEPSAAPGRGRKKAEPPVPEQATP